MGLRRSLSGAAAGGLGTAIWAAQQPLDQRLFRCGYDDVALLGKLVTRGPAWQAVGTALHVGNGATLGIAYSQVRHLLPGPPVVRGVIASMVVNFSLWPLGRLVDRHHPARAELTPLTGNGRALAQATWRHLLWGVVLGELEHLLSARTEHPAPIPATSNGRGDIEAAVSAV